jgi:hypothetical protein
MDIDERLARAHRESRALYRARRVRRDRQRALIGAWLWIVIAPIAAVGTAVAGPGGWKFALLEVFPLLGVVRLWRQRAWPFRLVPVTAAD